MSHKKNYKKKKAVTAATPAPAIVEPSTVAETPAESSAPAPAEPEAAAAQPAPTPAVQDVVKTDWKPIIKDFVILLIIMGILGYACNLIKDAFAYKSPTDSLVSLIRKGDIKDVDGTMIDEPFINELDEGIAKNADFVNTRDANERTPLMWAAYANFNDPEQAASTDINRLYYIETLLDRKANIYAKDEDGFTALHWAAWSGMRFTTYLLVDAGLDINAPESNGFTPLMLAAMRGNDTVVDLLLKFGADPTLKNYEGKTAAELATSSASAYSKRNSFLYGPVFSINRQDSYSRTCKLLAEAKGKITDEELKQLEVHLAMEVYALQSSANAERKMEKLFKREEDRATVSLIPLVSRDEADIDLHHRVRAEAEAIVELEKKIEDPEYQSAFLKTDDTGNTALHIAARTGKALCCYELIQVGFDVTAKNKEGKTPIMLAAANGHALALKVLLSVDKAGVEIAAEEAASMLQTMPELINGDTIVPMLINCMPLRLELVNHEFEIRREASDKEYAKAKLAAAAKAKADEEARIKAEEEARARAAAEEKAKQEALQQAQKLAAEQTQAAQALMAEAQQLKQESEQAQADAQKVCAAAELAQTEAEAAKAQAQQAQEAAAAAQAEAYNAREAAAAMRLEAEKEKSAAAALKAEAEAAKAEAEAAKAAAAAAQAEAEAAKAAAEAPAAEQPAA